MTIGKSERRRAFIEKHYYFFYFFIRTCEINSQVFFIFGTARSENFAKHFFISCLFFFRKWAVGHSDFLHSHKRKNTKKKTLLRPFQKPPFTFFSLPKNQGGCPPYALDFKLRRFCKLLYLSSIGQKNLFFTNKYTTYKNDTFYAAYLFVVDYISSVFKQL